MGILCENRGSALTRDPRNLVPGKSSRTPLLVHDGEGNVFVRGGGGEEERASVVVSLLLDDFVRSWVGKGYVSIGRCDGRAQRLTSFRLVDEIRVEQPGKDETSAPSSAVGAGGQGKRDAHKLVPLYNLGGRVVGAGGEQDG